MTLRDRLRSDTRAAHQRLDGLMARIDVATPDGLIVFLTMQNQSLAALAPSAHRSRAKSIVDDLRKRTVADLRLLGQPVDTREEDGKHRISALAIDYIVGGSQAGSKLLRRRWATSRNPLVQSASHFFQAPERKEFWRAFCITTEAHAPNGPLADGVLADTDSLFRLFHRNAEIALARLPSGHAKVF